MVGFLEIAKTVLLIVSALFPIVNPLGGSPVFLLLTDEYSPSARRQLARQVALNSFVLLAASFLIGTHVLTFFGISIPVVQVGGGLIVISTGWAMLKQKDEVERHAVQREVNASEIQRNAFYPLTLPLTVGPGSISVAITIGANAPRHLGPNLRVLVASVVGSVLIALSIYICYGFSDRLARALGSTGMAVMMRLSSFLLVCIGVQILWNGASALFRQLVVAP